MLGYVAFGFRSEPGNHGANAVLHSVGIVLLMLIERAPWKCATQAAVGANGLTILDSTRVFALLNIAAHDTQAVGPEHK